jgi:hypothetical protein
MSIFRRKPQKPPKPPEPICGCGHHAAYHDRETRRCGHTTARYSEIEEAIRTEKGNPVRDRYDDVQTVHKSVYEGSDPCGCHGYIGPEPISTYTAMPLYLPEISS